MADENKTERVQLLMTPSEVRAIDDWSFEKRIRGRAEAIRRLCQIGMGIDAKSDDIIDDADRVHEVIRDIATKLVRDIRSGKRIDINEQEESLMGAYTRAVEHFRLVVDTMSVLKTLTVEAAVSADLEEAVRVYEKIKGASIAKIKTEATDADD